VNERRLKVLHIVDTLSMGGAETWLMELLRLWHRQGPGVPQIDILATSGDPGIFDDEARTLGAKIHYLRFSRSNLASFARGFRRILKDGAYAAIHDHQDYASGWHFLMGGRLLPPVRVAHVHSPWIHIEADYAVSPTRKAATTIGKWLVRSRATHVCGTSAEVLERYGFPVGGGRRPEVSVVHCGIDVGKFNAPRESDRQAVLRELGWPPETKVVLFAGRLDRALEFGHPQNHKNSWFALSVMRAALEQDPSLRLLMAGAGDDSRRAMESHIEDWGLQTKLRLIGVRNDMPRLMRAADVLLFPSHQEGLGMVAVEAQAACLPVLASTAVPRECVVIPALYDALSLGEPIELWSAALLRATAKPRLPLESSRVALESSAFSIANSARRLQDIYGASRS